MPDIDFILIFFKKVELHAYRDLIDMISQELPELCQECNEKMNTYLEKLENRFKHMITNKLHRLFDTNEELTEI